MAGGRTTIGAGQYKNSIRAEGLQSGLDQGTGMAESIQIDQIEAPPLELGLTQQPFRGNTAAGCRRHRPEVVLQQGPPIAIGIVHHDLRGHRTGCPGLKPPAQPSDAASGHQIKPQEGLFAGCRPGLMPGQQHRTIPGRPRVAAEEAVPEQQLGCPLAIVRFRIDQCFDRHCSPDCRLG